MGEKPTQADEAARHEHAIGSPEPPIGGFGAAPQSSVSSAEADELERRTGGSHQGDINVRRGAVKRGTDTTR